MSSYRHVLVALLGLTWVGLVRMPLAEAQEAQNDPDAAKAHFSRGTRFYEVGDYRQAIEEFRAAHLAKPDPAFLYNLGQCHRLLGELEQAVTLYKRFLAASPNGTNRAEIEKRVAEMEAELTARKRGRTAESPRPQPVAPAPAPAPIGPLQVTPATPPVSSPGIAAQPAAVATSAGPTGTGSSLGYLRWVGVGVTTVLVGGAIAVGMSASSRYDKLEGGCAKTNTGCSEGEIDGVKSRALLTNILWGAAGVAAIGTGLAFVLTPHGSTVQVAWRF